MKILIIGGSGQVGQHIKKHCDDFNIDAISTSFSLKDDRFIHLDISDYVETKKIIEDTKPDLLFLASAITKVDDCEKKPSLTAKTNILGVENVVNCFDKKTRLVFYSTDYVFDGVAGLYNENSAPNPINEYGYQKLCAENYIKRNCENHLIIRTSSVYGNEEQNKNFIARLLLSLKENKKVLVPMDEYCTPTYNEDLAYTSIMLALYCPMNYSKQDVIHLVGDTLCSRYRFALQAAKTFDLDVKLIKPVLSCDLKRPAKRPLNSGLISSRFLNSIFDGLVKMKKGIHI